MCMLQCPPKRRRRAAEPDVPDNTTEVVNYQIKVVETVQERKSPRMLFSYREKISEVRFVVTSKEIHTANSAEICVLVT